MEYCEIPASFGVIFLKEPSSFHESEVPYRLSYSPQRIMVSQQRLMVYNDRYICVYLCHSQDKSMIFDCVLTTSMLQNT